MATAVHTMIGAMQLVAASLKPLNPAYIGVGGSSLYESVKVSEKTAPKQMK